MQSCAVDCLWNDGRAAIGEIGYRYEAWIVGECPDHWELRGDVEIATSEQCTAKGKPVRYIRSMCLPGDARVTCLFEADDADAVRDVSAPR